MTVAARARAMVLVTLVLWTTCLETLGMPCGSDFGSLSLEIPEVIFENQEITFNCSGGVTNGPYHWSLNGSILSGYTNEQLTVVVPLSWMGSCLTCHVQGQGEVTNVSRSLTVLARSPPTILTSPISETINESESLLLTCRAFGLPPPTIIWLRNGAFLTSMNSSSFIIASASDEDSGNYTCRAYYSGRFVSSDVAVVRVRFSPVIEISPESTDVLNNSMTLLNCSASGYPEPIISWQHNGEDVIAMGSGDDDRVEILPNGSLVIWTVMMSDMGSYQCFASNSLGSAQSDSALLTVDVFPQFRVGPIDKNVDLSARAELECFAIGVPEPTYLWLRCRDGAPPVPVQLSDRVREINGTLMFDSIVREDSGMYKCVAMNEHGNVTSRPVGLWVIAPPLPPQGLRVRGRGSSWLELVWNASITHPPIIRYIVEYRLTFNLTVFKHTVVQPQPHANVTQLYPFAEYSIRVRANSTRGVSAPSSEVLVMTLEGAPLAGVLIDQVEEVMVQSNASDSLFILWIIPPVLESSSFNQTRLTVQTLHGDVHVNEIVESPVTVSGLTPATTYTISLTLVFMGGDEGTTFLTNATTMEAIPGDGPRPVMAFPVNQTAVRVTWGPPSLPNGVITSYTIYYAAPSDIVLSVGGEVMSHILQGLRPYTNYTIRISANTSKGEGPSSGVVVRTLQDVPPPPSGVTATALNSTALLVSWQPFNEEDVPGILTNFTIRYNLVHHGGHPNYQGLARDQSSAIVGGLLPFNEYRVSVAASTEAGQGPFSNKVAATTFGAVPRGSVGDVLITEFCPTSLLVQWTPPNSRYLGGPVTEVHYVLFYNTSNGEQDNRTFPYNSTMRSYMLEDVSPLTDHSVQLALRNGNGTGQFSDLVSNTSCDGAAPPPNVTLVQGLSSTTILVRWQAPPSSSLPGTLVGYVVRYRTGSDPYSNKSVNSTVTEWVIEDLEPFQVYSVGVATQTRGPLGNFSVEQEARTFGDVPVAVVSGVMVMPGCPSNLLVSWNHSSLREIRGNAALANYSVTYNSSGDESGTVLVPYSPNGPMVNLSGLMVNTVYSVMVALINSNGSGPPSSPEQGTTPMEGVPSAPRNINISNVGASSLVVSWSPPSRLSGQANYTVHYSSDPSHPTTVSHSPQSPLSLMLEDLLPFTEYTIVVEVRNLCGSNSTVVMETTLESPPSTPLNVRVVALLSTKVRVQWDRPERPNGMITHYIVNCSGSSVENSSSLWHECQELKPETRYQITVAAVNGAGIGPGSPVLLVNTTCSPDIKTLQQNKVNIQLKESCSVSTEFMLVVVEELVTYDNGSHSPVKPLDNYTLEKLIQMNKEYSNSRPAGRTHRRATLNRGGVYIAANISAEELVDGGFVLGDAMERGGYTNYPLRSDLFYNFILWGTVLGTDTPLISNSNITIMGGEPTDSTTSEVASPTIPVVAVAGAAGAALVLILAICMAAIISCICCCCNRSLEKSSEPVGVRIERTGSFRLSTKKKHSDPVDEFRSNHRVEVMEDHPPVPVMGFINKLMVMRTNDNQLFLEEFGSIPMTIANLSTDIATSAANKPKNRYNNILPYDNNRVKVKGHGSDYINASYCSGYRKSKAYIATQGPLPDTIGDLWRMVWEENVRTMVMLTNVQEKGKIKCEMYWPRDLGSSSVHGNLDVTLSAITTLADYSIRTFSLQKAGSSKEPRKVVQFHFTSWPDHGVPQYATAMLAMMRRVRAHYTPSEEGPMLVHCSAGVGRTGTFIVIDSMLQRLVHHEEMIDIYGHVSLLRTQRNYMVQTEDQYFFIHEAIAEALLCGNTEVPMNQLPGYVVDLYSVIPEDESDTTSLEIQFKRLALERNDPHRWIVASKDANKTKNRFVNVLPYDSSRVCLEYRPGVDGSDYINASHVDSYHTRRAFIATQGPLANTVDDFWQMLWQYSVPVVIMLTEEVERDRECSVRYWPEAILESVNYGKFKVELNVERNSGTYSYRDLTVVNTASEEKRLIRQFQFHGWPEVGVPPPMVVIDFLREVQKLYQSLSTQGPIVVHCSNGVGRTGVFITLHIVLERLLVEGLVDIFQTVKNLRIQRPAMVQTLEQYHFCYDAAATFLQSSEISFPSPSHQPSSSSHQRGSSLFSSSRHGSRHGSHSSVDSRKKSKNASPARSPSRSASLRNTPVRSDSLRESPRGTMDLNGTGASHSQVYGGSSATSTFGSHLTPTSSPFTCREDGASAEQQLGPSPAPGSQTPPTFAQTPPIPVAQGNYYLSNSSQTSQPGNLNSHPLAATQRQTINNNSFPDAGGGSTQF